MVLSNAFKSKKLISGMRAASSDNHRPKPIYLNTNLQLVFGVTLMAVLGVSSITPTFPVIIEEFNISPQLIGMLITVFTLPGIVITPLLGILAVRFGRKRILIPSMLLFGMAGAACALARDYNLLLFLRFLQGIGAASRGSLNVDLDWRFILRR